MTESFIDHAMLYLSFWITKIWFVYEAIEGSDGVVLHGVLWFSLSVVVLNAHNSLTEVGLAAKLMVMAVVFLFFEIEVPWVPWCIQVYI